MTRELPPYSDSEKSDPHLLTLLVGGGDKRVASLQQHGEHSDPHLLTLQVGVGDKKVASLQRHSEKSDPHLSLIHI